MFSLFVFILSQISVVGRLRAGRPKTLDPFPAGLRIIVSKVLQTGFGVHPISYAIGVGVFFALGK